MTNNKVQVLLAEGQHAHAAVGTDVQEITPERFKGQQIGDRPVVFRVGKDGATIVHQVPLRHDIGGNTRTPHAAIEVAPNTVGVAGIQREFNPLENTFMLVAD